MGVVATAAWLIESPAALEVGDGPGLNAPETGIEATPGAGTFAPGPMPEVAAVAWGLVVTGLGMGIAAPVAWDIEAAGPAEAVMAEATGGAAGPVPPGPGRDIGPPVP